jgi:hypothetical protein
VLRVRGGHANLIGGHVGGLLASSLSANAFYFAEPCNWKSSTVSNEADTRLASLVATPKAKKGYQDRPVGPAGHFRVVFRGYPLKLRKQVGWVKTGAEESEDKRGDATVWTHRLYLTPSWSLFFTRLPPSGRSASSFFLLLLMLSLPLVSCSSFGRVVLCCCANAAACLRAADQGKD